MRLRPALVASTLVTLVTLAAPRPAAAQAGDMLVVLNKNVATATLVDVATGRALGTMPTGPYPHEVVVSPDGRRAVVADYGAQEPGRTLTVLDLVSRRAERTIDLGEHRRPHGIVWLPGGARVAVTCEQTQALVLVDVNAGAVVGAIPTAARGTHMVALHRDGRRAYTANIGSGTVSLVDLGARQLVRSVTTGRGPEAIDVSPDGREVWAADRNLNHVRVPDARTLDSLATMPSGEFPNRLKFTPDGRWALVSNAASSTVGVYDARARVLVTTIALPLDSAKAPAEHLASPMGRSAVPLGILVSPDGRRAWVATNATGQLAEIDLARRAVVRWVDAGETPDGMAYVPGRGARD